MFARFHKLYLGMFVLSLVAAASAFAGPDDADDMDDDSNNTLWSKIVEGTESGASGLVAKLVKTWVGHSPETFPGRPKDKGPETLVSIPGPDGTFYSVKRIQEKYDWNDEHEPVFEFEFEFCGGDLTVDEVYRAYFMTDLCQTEANPLPGLPKTGPIATPIPCDRNPEFVFPRFDPAVRDGEQPTRVMRRLLHPMSETKLQTANVIDLDPFFGALHLTQIPDPRFPAEQPETGAQANLSRSIHSEMRGGIDRSRQERESIDGVMRTEFSYNRKTRCVNMHEYWDDGAVKGTAARMTPHGEMMGRMAPRFLATILLDRNRARGTRPLLSWETVEERIRNR